MRCRSDQTTASATKQSSRGLIAVHLPLPMGVLLFDESGSEPVALVHRRGRCRGGRPLPLPSASRGYLLVVD